MFNPQEIDKLFVDLSEEIQDTGIVKDVADSISEDIIGVLCPIHENAEIGSSFIDIGSSLLKLGKKLSKEGGWNAG